MWPDLVVVLPPVLEFVSGMVDITPRVLVQALVAYLAVEAFDVSILSAVLANLDFLLVSK